MLKVVTAVLFEELFWKIDSIMKGKRVVEKYCYIMLNIVILKSKN